MRNLKVNHLGEKYWGEYVILGSHNYPFGKVFSHCAFEVFHLVSGKQQPKVVGCVNIVTSFASPFLSWWREGWESNFLVLTKHTLQLLSMCPTHAMQDKNISNCPKINRARPDQPSQRIKLKKAIFS